MAARRAPGAEDRLRDAERSRELILDAALYEFGERGFAGARTVAIARRAGVNPQLISYYFDGKAGLYRALTARIRGETGPLDDLDTPLEEVVARFVHVNLEHRAWARLLIWEALSPRVEDQGDGSDGNGASAFYRQMVAAVARRQDRGEVGSDLDPGTVLVVLFSAALAPVALPELTEVATGGSPSAPRTIEAYLTGLRAVVRRLR